MNDADYMRAAIRASVASTDRSRKVGCVIVNDLGIVAEGYNAFPVGVMDVEERHARPEKYFWTEHAERSAIYEAAKNGVSLRDSTIYVPWFPCMDCARAIALSGVKEIVAVRPDLSDPKWGPDFQRVETFFREVGVEVRFVDLPAD